MLSGVSAVLVNIAGDPVLMAVEPGGGSERRRNPSERRENYLIELIDQNNKNHQEAHVRLRKDLTALEERVEEALKLLHDKQITVTAKVTELATTPVDVTKLVATPRIVFAIVTTVVLIFSTIWASNAGLRSDVRDILTRIQTEQRVNDEKGKLQEVHSQMIKDSLAAVQKRQELLTLQYNQLNEQMIRLMNQKGQ